MAVISLQNISKSFGDKPVLDGFSVAFERSERVGLVGANGAGKSTVLRIIAGREKADTGVVHVARGVRLGYLPQEANFRSDRTLREALLAVFHDLREGAKRLRELEERLGERGANPAGWDTAVLEEYTDLLARFEQRGGYTYEGRVEQVLSGLGFARDLWDKPATALSGGQRTRARLARLLLEEPDFLLLDEPTNHLDLETTEWLETFLAGWRRGLVVVSHDRYFLDKVSRRTVEVVGGKAESYPAPYSRYLYLRAERYRRQQKEYQTQQARIAKTEEFIRRNSAGQRAKEARGRQKQLDRLERVERAPQGRGRDALGSLRLGAGTRSGEVVLSTVRLRVGYPGKSLLALPNVQVGRGQRIALIGPNGAGKSTLLRTLVGEIPPLGGSFAWGSNVEVGYYAQGHEGLRRDRTVLAEVQDARPMTEEAARGYLGRFLFTGEDVFKRVGELSGGERSRVALARLTLRQANMLLLDEPTNHLDIAARDALAGVLRGYDGTIVFVSHDRYFIDAVATTIWSVEDGVVRVYPGTYAAYREARARGLPPPPAPDDALPQARPARQRASARRAERPTGPAPVPFGEARDAEVAALVEAARTLEEARHGLGSRLARVQGQTLDGLVGLAEEHARAQEELEASDARLLAAIRRGLG